MSSRTDLPALPAYLAEQTGRLSGQPGEGRSGPTYLPAPGRQGWYVRALTEGTETFARPAVDALTAVLVADALRRSRPGWRVVVRRYGTVPRQRAA